MTDALQFTGWNFFLSNFYPCDILLTGQIWPTDRPESKADIPLTFRSVEHAYQALKSKDVAVWLAFTNPLMSAAGAKRQGAKVRVRSDWEQIKLEVMKALIRKKFKDADLMKRLMAIDGLIQEGNTWGDKYWGVDLRTGLGENNLGKILMMIRDQHRGGQ
jgi:ribA/ribD-fused uncharacterized protein